MLRKTAVRLFGAKYWNAASMRPEQRCSGKRGHELPHSRAAFRFNEAGAAMLRKTPPGSRPR